eukprot:6553809-Alexandrium_andersonii.AAC.1
MLVEGIFRGASPPRRPSSSRSSGSRRRKGLSTRAQMGAATTNDRQLSEDRFAAPTLHGRAERAHAAGF